MGYNLWDLPKTLDNAQKQMTEAVMDAILQHNSLRVVYEGVMLSANAAQVVRNQSLRGKDVGRVTNKFMNISTSDISTALSSSIGLIDMSLIIDQTVAYGLALTDTEWAELWEKTLAMPNIGGIPISTSMYQTSRQIDVGEQLMIVQSKQQKEYWTDNAVPRLKEYTIEGYITSSLVLDQRYIVKPSLKMQLNFLDTCAESRRPVLFKDNRGEFLFVQIMNLQTTEEPSYNNAIKVSISLKEYKPYIVENSNTELRIASTNLSELRIG